MPNAKVSRYLSVHKKLGSLCSCVAGDCPPVLRVRSSSQNTGEKYETEAAHSRLLHVVAVLDRLFFTICSLRAVLDLRPQASRHSQIPTNARVRRHEWFHGASIMSNTNKHFWVTYDNLSKFVKIFYCPWSPVSFWGCTKCRKHMKRLSKTWIDANELVSVWLDSQQLMFMKITHCLLILRLSYGFINCLILIVLVKPFRVPAVNFFRALRNQIQSWFFLNRFLILLKISKPLLLTSPLISPNPGLKVP